MGGDRPEDEIGQMILSLRSTQIKLGFDVLDMREQANSVMRMQQALDNASVPVTVPENRNTLIFMNRATHKMIDDLGENIRRKGESFVTDSLIGTSLADFFPGEKLVQIYKVKLTETKETLFDAWSYKLKLITSPVYDHDGDYQGRVTQWIDITEELKVEQEINAIVAAAKGGDLTRRIDLEGK